MRTNSVQVIDQRIERLKAKLKCLRAERRLSVYLERERRASEPMHATPRPLFTEQAEKPKQGKLIPLKGLSH